MLAQGVHLAAGNQEAHQLFLSREREKVLPVAGDDGFETVRVVGPDVAFLEIDPFGLSPKCTVILSRYISAKGVTFITPF